MRTPCLLVIACLMLTASAAQQPLYTYYQRYSTDEGLPQSFISSMVQDKDGFLWIATRDGLARYDGRQFRTFRPPAADSSLSTEVILTMLYDSRDRIWILFENSQLRCFHTRSLKWLPMGNFPLIDSLSKKVALRLLSERNDQFWSLRWEGGLRMTDINNNRIAEFTKGNGKLASDEILSFAEDGSGRLWLYHDSGLEVSDTSRTRFRFIPFPAGIRPDKSITVPYPGLSFPLLCLPGGQVVAGNYNRLLFYDEKTNLFRVISCGKKETGIADGVKSLLAGADSLLYIEKMGHLFRLEKNGTFTYLWNYPANEYHYAQSLLLDRSNVCWFGTNAGGLYKIDFASLPFTSSGYRENFHADVMSRIILDASGRLPETFLKTRESYNFRYCYAPGGSLFFSVYGNEQLSGNPVYLFRNGSISTLHMPGIPENNICSMGWSRSGELMATSVNNMLYRWKDPDRLPEVKQLHGITGGAVADMETDRDGGYWLLTQGSGLYHFKDDTLLRVYSYFDKKNYLPSDRFTDMITDPDDENLLWIGTLGKGLLLFDKKKGYLRRFTMEEGLPNNTVYTVVPDKQGYLWFSTNKGIGRLHRRNYSVTVFDISDGLPENEFNRFYSFVFPDGRIAFGGGKGYTVFDPSLFREDHFATPVRITGFSVNNKNLEYGDDDQLLPKPINDLEKLVLPYHKNFLSFEFTGLAFNQPGKIRYRYILKGYDKDWVISGTRNLATYTKLPPGTYTLLLNASNSSGRWSPDVKKLLIRIRPPFWATWWATTFYGLVILSLISLYWKYRNRRIRMQNEIALEQSKAQHLKEVDEIKERFFSNITHELRTPLTLIFTPLEKLKDDPKYPPEDRRIFTNAFTNAGRLLRLINQLLDISKIESGQMKVHTRVGDIALFLQEAVQQFELRAGEKNIRLQFINKDVSGLYLFDPEKWEKILFNLVGNAIKFTPEGGSVDVSVSSVMGEGEKAPGIRLAVKDTGKGIAPDQLSRLFDRFYMADDSATRTEGGTGIGLALVRELTELMHGKVVAESEPGKGCRFVVEIPVTRAGAAEKLAAPDETTCLPVEKDELNKEIPLVLVAEDNDELRMFITGSLEPRWRVIATGNGRAAFDLAVKEMPDIIVSDVMMPGMDGYALCQLVKEDPRTGHIGFILLTAKAAQESRLEGLKQGADAYLTKPFHQRELEQNLQNLVDQQERLRKHLQKQLLPEAPLQQLPHVHDIFIQELYRQMDEHIDDPALSVETLARLMMMSQRSLHRKLTAILNISPVEFIRRYRLQKAAILISSGHSIADTAYSVGFETASYFSQCFREQFGKTPTEFANQKPA